jgi:hypothetical protein
MQRKPHCNRLGPALLAVWANAPLRTWALTIALALGAPAAVLAQAQTPPLPRGAPVMVFSADAPADSYAFKWFNLIYTELFKRLGMGFRLESYALKRQGLQSESGAVDGEVNRAYGYAATQSTLVRVEEPIIDLTLALYTANPTLRLQRLEDIAEQKLLVEYRRGILLCENALKPLTGPDRLSDVVTYEQGLRKLLTQRTDLYCDFTLSIVVATHTLDLEGAGRIRKVLDISKLPTYPYLHNKHAELAPRMASTLKRMKAEGLVEAYRIQVERELGWGQ